MTPTSAKSDLGALEGVFVDSSVPRILESISPRAYGAAAQYWRAPLEAGALTPRLRELILLAMHATASALNGEAIVRQVKRARAAGASEADILETLILIVGLANHALYSSVPILEEEMAAEGAEMERTAPNPAFEDAKNRFIAARGFWNSDRDRLAGLLPDYLLALTELSVESWEEGQLTPKERELICIATDCTVNHTYEAGLRLHIRNALSLGASGSEILQVLQLASLLGLEGYILGAEALFASRP